MALTTGTRSNRIEELKQLLRELYAADGDENEQAEIEDTIDQVRDELASLGVDYMVNPEQYV